MSRAFVKDDQINESDEAILANRTVSSHPNLVTQSGLKALERQLQLSQDALVEAKRTEDDHQKKRRTSPALRDIKYYSERLRTARMVTPEANPTKIGFGHLVSIRYDDGRTFSYRIVGEDESNPSEGRISFASPMAQKLMGKSLGQRFTLGNHEIEILDIF